MAIIRNLQPCRFGLILDADGVITRGRDLLPGSKEALHMITDVDGRFKIPTVSIHLEYNSVYCFYIGRCLNFCENACKRLSSI